MIILKYDPIRRCLAAKTVLLPFLLSISIVTGAIVELPMQAAMAAKSDDASPVATSRERTGKDGNSIGQLLIHGKRALTIRTPNGKLQPADRVRIAADRLNDVLSSRDSDLSITAKQNDSDLWVVDAGGVTLLIANEKEATALDITPEALARRWARGIRSVLDSDEPKVVSKPKDEPKADVKPEIKPEPQKPEAGVTLASDSITIPLGETRTVSVGGAAPVTTITSDDSDAEIVHGDFDSSRRSLIIHALSVGKGSVTVHSDQGGSDAKIDVTVQRYAGEVAPGIEVAVSGDPSTPADVVTQALYQGILRAVSMQPQTAIRFGRITPASASLDIGDTYTQKVPVTITGPDLFTVDASVAVKVTNKAIAQQEASTLLYSNNPERVPSAQELYRGKLRPLKSVRLDYHHQNISGSQLFFRTELVNDSDVPASVHVIAGMSLPAMDTFRVGYKAGLMFMKSLSTNTGIVLDIPPHSRAPVIAQRLPDGLTVSGIVQMQQLTGPASGLDLRVAADNDDTIVNAPAAQLVQNSLGRNTILSPILQLAEVTTPAADAPAPLSAHVYDLPRIPLHGEYKVGGMWEHLKLGQVEALTDKSGKQRLFGNYGATYDITINVTNPTDKTKTVVVMFDPTAGYAAGVFLMQDGSIVDFDPIQSPNDREVMRTTLTAGETQTLKMSTIPLNGSFYPVTLVVHSL